jgi:hypothetical protein
MTVRDEPAASNTVEMRVALNLNEHADDDLAAEVLGVMRMSIARLPALLRLTHSSDAMSHWMLSPIPRSDGILDGEVIASLPSSSVRTVLAFFGATIMRNQLYGGYMHRLVRVDDTEFRAVIYMSNFNAVGWWLRAYLFPLTGSPETVPDAP